VNVREGLYALARRVFRQEARDRISARIAGGRKRLAPLIRRVNGAFDAAELGRELAGALPARFDALMVHCSYDDLLPMYSQGVGQLLETLRALCGPERTLVMPAFTFHVPGGDLARHFRAHPRFDARRQPSQMGLLSEVFRRTPGVLRSLHPTHSVCVLGPRAADLVAGHHLAPTTFGAGSPFARMAELDTVILGLGKPFYRVLTQTHVPEDLLGQRFPVSRTFEEVDLVVVDGAGEHPYRFRIDTTAVERRVHRLRRLLAPGDLTEWRFHGVPLFWTRAGRITEALCDAALRGRTIYAGPTLA
jgi:aminoglycoside N3'-acetyltransferase